MNQQVLLLNSSYEPLSVIDWQRAMCLWFSEKADIVSEYSNVIIKTVKNAFNCPAVLRLKSYINPRRQERLVRFSKLNIHKRDNFTCSYCGDQPGLKKLTIDHIIPKSRCKKNPTTWTNIITACKDCNFAKANRTPDEAKMPLRFKPYQPTFAEYRTFKTRKHIPKEWEDYLS